MKLKLIIATFLSMFLFSAAQAGSFGMGVTGGLGTVSYTHLRAHETPEHLV